MTLEAFIVQRKYRVKPSKKSDPPQRDEKRIAMSPGIKRRMGRTDVRRAEFGLQSGGVLENLLNRGGLRSKIRKSRGRSISSMRSSRCSSKVYQREEQMANFGKR
jgi:hypothetical protein